MEHISRPHTEAILRSYDWNFYDFTLKIVVFSIAYSFIFANVSEDPPTSIITYYSVMRRQQVSPKRWYSLQNAVDEKYELMSCNDLQFGEDQTFRRNTVFINVLLLLLISWFAFVSLFPDYVPHSSP
jgi:hypothetical protein